MGQIAGNQIIDYDGETYPVNWYGACPTKILVSCGKAASGGAMGRDLDLMGMYKKQILVQVLITMAGRSIKTHMRNTPP